VICTLDEILRYLGKAGTATQAELDLIGDLWPVAEKLVKNFVNGPVESAACVDLLPAPSGRDVPDLEFVGWDRVGDRAVGITADAAARQLQLSSTPVRSVQAVYETWNEGGAAAPLPGSLLDPAEYYLDAEEPGLSRSGLLVRWYSSWPSLARSVRVEYVAGYTSAELDPQALNLVPEFKQAVRQTVAKAFHTARTMHDQQLGFGGVGPLSAEGMDGVTFSYDSAAVRPLLGQVTDLPQEVKVALAQHVNYGRMLGR
jgi:hypothetical protein